MYTEFYGLKIKPFSLTPDPKFLYLSAVHQKCASVLQYGMLNNAGFTVVTGEIGSGKSTLIQYLLNTLDYNIVTVGHINNTFNIHADLLAWVLDSFDIDPGEDQSRVARYRKFTDFVISEYSEGRRVILIIDEAQNLDENSVEELRLLSNINIAEDIVLQMVFLGQPELIELLESPNLQQFTQRIGIEFNIPPLDFQETKKYIIHRLEVAGASEQIFTEEALAAIYCYSGGLPRRINNIADMALVYGYAEEVREVGADTVNNTIIDRSKTGLFKVGLRDSEDIAAVESWLAESQNIRLVEI